MFITQAQTKNYLSNYINTYSPYSYSGKLSFGNCRSIIDNGNYVMCFSTRTTLDYTPEGVPYYPIHATAVIGYYISGTSNSIYMFDPHKSGNGKLVVTYSSTLSYSSNGYVFVWDAGYFSNFG